MLISSFLSSFRLVFFLLPIPFPSLLFSTNFFPILAFLLFSLYKEVLSWSTLSHLLITWHNNSMQAGIAAHVPSFPHNYLLTCGPDLHLHRKINRSQNAMSWLPLWRIDLIRACGKMVTLILKKSSLSIPFLVCDIVRSQHTATRQRKPTLLN